MQQALHAIEKIDWQSDLERIEILGEGASAVSFRCWSAQLSKHVVVKQYKHALYQVDPDVLFREMQFLNSLDHPKIPKYLGHYVAEVQGRALLHLVIDYIEGESLEVVHRENRWSLSESLSVINQVMEIVDYLHSLQPPVIHRDIKPSNLLLQSQEDGSWQVFLIDFGTAMDSIHHSMGATQNIGTVGYAPLEQIQGFPACSSDVYSIGVVAWELLTRCRAKDYLQGPYLNWRSAARDLPAFVVEWLEGMLEEEELRYQTAGEALTELNQLSAPQENVPVTVRTTAKWTEEAARHWLLLVSKTTGTPREKALTWWKLFSAHQDTGEMRGLFYVIRAILLDRPTFRLVEYLQDLVFHSSNGLALWIDYCSSIEQLSHLDRDIQTCSTWNLWRQRSLQNTKRDLTQRLLILHQALETACQPWLEFVNVNASDTVRLLRSTRPSMMNSFSVNLINLPQSSLEMIAVSTDRIHIMMSSTPVSQQFYRELMGVNPSESVNALHPVESITWIEAVLFCNRLSRQFGLSPVYEVIDATAAMPQVNRLDTDGFCLPTWKEWNYIARSETLYQFAGSDDAHQVGWVAGATTSHQRLASKPPNDWGFYDMTGNVAEWCEDTSLSAPQERLVAGGSFRDGLEWVQVGAHYFENIHLRSVDLGFRVARRLTA